MVSKMKQFLDDRRGTTFEGIALSVAIVAVSFVAAADMLDYMTKSHGPAEMIASAAPAAPSTSNANLDETPTASLPKLVSRSVLDPCTGTIR